MTIVRAGDRTAIANRRALPVLVALGWIGLFSLGSVLASLGALGHHVRKLFEMFLALVSIQLLSARMTERLGPTVGAGLTAFAGGLISSTAMTAEIAKRSKERAAAACLFEYLGSVVAMLIEAFALVCVGIGSLRDRTGLLFAFPIAVGTLGAVLGSRTANGKDPGSGARAVGSGSTLRLASFLVILTAFAFYGTRMLGNASVYAVTFVASLFEVHAVTIANAALRDARSISERQLGDLVALSTAASLTSKLFIVASLGSRAFFRQALRWTLGALLSIAIAWAVLRVA